MLQHIKKLLHKKKVISVLFYGFLIFTYYTTLAPTDGMKSGFFSRFLFEDIDKVIHFLAFFILGILIYPTFPKLNFFVYQFILFAIGLSIEILQHYMPFDRTFDVKDLIFDQLGAIIGVLLSRYFYDSVVISESV